MRRGYFTVAWNDIRTSNRWLRNLLLLALVNMVPLVGPIFVLGYAYGWARDAAWGIRTPMPEHPFARTGDRLLRRGVDLLVLLIFFMLVPILVSHCREALFVNLMVEQWSNVWDLYLPFRVVLAIQLIIVGGFYVFAMIAVLFVLVGWMRVAIYGRLSAGFQIARIWSMIRYEFSGLLRICGIVLITFAAVQLVVLIFALIVGRLGIMAAILQTFAGQSVEWGTILNGLLPVAIAGIPVVLYAVSVVSVLGGLLLARALGYWTAQFDVSHWLGQDDPMPFEARQSREREEREKARAAAAEQAEEAACKGQAEAGRTADSETAPTSVRGAEAAESASADA